MIFDYLNGLKYSAMNLNETKGWYNRVCELLRMHRLIDALDKISSVIPANGITVFSEQLDEIRFTYSNMLTYSLKGIEDPSRKQIYNHLLISTYELADQVKLGLLNQPGHQIAAAKLDLDRQARRDSEDLAENLLGLSFDHELNDMLHNTALFNDETESEQAILHRKAILRAFHHLWLTNNFTEDDSRVVSRIFESSSLPWYEKAMMVSALTLGLIRGFDVRKIELLINLHSHDDPQISQRALVGILLSFSLYDRRFAIYPQLNTAVLALGFDDSFANDAVAAITQIIRSKDTDRITRKFRDEIIPDIIKFNEDLSEKLNLDKLLRSDEEIDKNPDWEKYFDNQPDLVQKLEELTNMQMEGADVFLGAFSMLKSFDFFHDLHNWFMPFYREHYAVVHALRGEAPGFGDILMKGIENSPYMCNSDKFSFVLNIGNLPNPQKEVMAQMFSAETEQFEELMNEETTDPQLRKRRIIIQYIQDLYRFFKLHRLRHETGDIFQLPLDSHNTDVFSGIISDPLVYKKLAVFYFDNYHYEEALTIFEKLSALGENNAELYEKSGYCHQQLEHFHQAIAMYRKADLFDTNRKWLIGKIAQCYLKLSDSPLALNAYLELSALEPENLRTTAALGTCYLNLGEFDKALECFYAIDFAEPGSARVMRPVAWCLFVLNRIPESEEYYRQLIDMEPNAYDFMNAGHVALCLGDKQLAAKYYKMSIQNRGGDLKSFLRGFAADQKLLVANGVDSADIPLILDYVRIILRTDAGGNMGN